MMNGVMFGLLVSCVTLYDGMNAVQVKHIHCQVNGRC